MLLFRAKQGVKGFIINFCRAERCAERWVDWARILIRVRLISEALVKNLSFYRFCSHSCLATKSRWHPNWHQQHDAIVSRLWFCFCHKKTFFVSVWYLKLASHDVSTISSNWRHSVWLGAFSGFQSFCIRFGDQEVIPARNIDWRSIFQKTLKQFGLVASK